MPTGQTNKIAAKGKSAVAHAGYAVLTCMGLVLIPAGVGNAAVTPGEHSRDRPAPACAAGAISRVQWVASATRSCKSRQSPSHAGQPGAAVDAR